MTQGEGETHRACGSPRGLQAIRTRPSLIDNSEALCTMCATEPQCTGEVRVVSTPVTIRLRADVMKAVQAKATRAGRPRSGMLAELVRLSLEILRYPGITFVEGPAGLRAHIAGSGLDVWEVVMVHRAHKGADEATLLPGSPARGRGDPRRAGQGTRGMGL